MGSLDYSKVRPILLKLDNPEQLVSRINIPFSAVFSARTNTMQREIEKWSPQILGHDEEIWRQFIKRDAPGFEGKFRSPPDNSLWYETYQRAVVQSRKEVADDERMLKAKMDEIKSHRSEQTSKQVAAATVPKLPQMGAMKYLKQLMKFDVNEQEWTHYQPRKPRPVSFAPQPKTKLTFGAGSRIKAKTGPEMLDKARKAAREQALLRRQLAIPTHKLQKQASRIRQVPYSLAADHMRVAVPQPIDPTIKPAEVFVPKRKRVVAEEESTESDPSSSNDETRSIKKPKMAPTGAASSEEAEIESMRLLALVKKSPQPQPLNQGGKPVRPPMKAKRPVNIFLPTKRR